jgi:hypothetical protein
MYLVQWGVMFHDSKTRPKYNAGGNSQVRDRWGVGTGAWWGWCRVIWGISVTAHLMRYLLPGIYYVYWPLNQLISTIEWQGIGAGSSILGERQIQSQHIRLVYLSCTSRVSLCYMIILLKQKRGSSTGCFDDIVFRWNNMIMKHWCGRVYGVCGSMAVNTIFYPQKELASRWPAY